MAGVTEIKLSGGDQFYIGMRPRFILTFRDIDDVLTDPTSFTIELELPNRQYVTYTIADSEVTQDSTGIFHFKPLLTVGGRHNIHVESDTSFAAAETRYFEVVRK